MRWDQLSRPCRLYIGSATVVALIVGAASWRWGGPGASLGPFLVLTGLGMAAHAVPIQGFRYQAYQVTVPLIVTAAALFNGVQLVAFIVLVHVAEQARVRRRFYIQWFNVCDYLVSVAMAAAVYHRVAATLPGNAIGEVSGAMAAGCTFVLVNRTLLALALRLARGLTFAASGLFKPELIAADLVLAWIAAPMVVLALQAGPVMLLIMAGPLLLARPALATLLGRANPRSIGRAQAPAA